MSNLTNTIETIMLSFIVVCLTASVYMNWEQGVEIAELKGQLTEQGQVLQFYATYCGNFQQPELLFPEPGVQQ